MTTDLAGRRLLVAGDPLAAAIVAERASACGAVVALATATRAEAPASTENDVLSYDRESESDVERAVDTVLERVHGLEGLIVTIETDTMAPIHDQGLASWERCVTQPLRTVFWLVRRGVHEWLASGSGGQIVLIIVSGHDEGRTRTASIIESALASLARSVAKEYGRRTITCNVVVGGSTPPAQLAAVETALFLASPAAGFVTGECLHVAEEPERCE